LRIAGNAPDRVFTPFIAAISDLDGMSSSTASGWHVDVIAIVS
jgi:hypothetical protein